MDYTEEETRPLNLLQTWGKTYNLRRATSGDAKCLCYMMVSETISGERVTRWKLGAINTYGSKALMDTFQEALTLVRTNAESGGIGENVTDILGLLIVSHGFGSGAVMHPKTGKPCRFTDLTKKQQKLVTEQATANELEAMQIDNVPCRIVNIISRTGLLGEVTMFVPNGEPRVEIAEQWADEVGEDNIRPMGAIDEVLIQTMTLLTLLSEVIRDGHEISPDGLLEYATEQMKKGGERAGAVMGLILKMLAHGFENNIFDPGCEDDEDDD